MTHQSWKRIGFLLLGLFLPAMLFLSSSAWACSCMNPGTPAESLERSDAVFIGEVVLEKPVMNKEQAKRKKQGRQVYIRTYEYRLKVEKSWKGVQEKTVTFVTGTAGTACEFGRLKVGQRFLFYAYFDKRKYFFPVPVLSTSSCTRSRSADDAGVEVLFLDAAAQNKDPSPIYRKIPTILKSHKNPLHRAAAARYLKYDTPSPFPEGTVDALLAGLKDRDPMVRKTVAGVITDQNFKRHRKVWRDALNKAYEVENKRLEKNPKSMSIREAFRSIAGALVVYGDREAHLKMIPYFIRDLNDEKSSTHLNSITKLLVIGPEARSAIPAIKPMMNHEDSFIRRRTVEALSAIQPQVSMKEIIKGLDDDDCEVLSEAVKALDEIESPKAKQLLKVKGIPRLIEKKNSTVCMFSRYVLGNLGVPLTPFVPQMIEVLNAPTNTTRNSIRRVMHEDLIEILGKIGPKAHQAIPVLERALKDRNEEIRKAAQTALDSIKAFDRQGSKTTLGELGKQLTGPVTPEWYRIVRQIRKLDNPKTWEILNRKVVPRLIRKWDKGKLKDQEARSLVKALQELSPQAKDVFPVFLEALKHSDAMTRFNAIMGLKKLGESGKPAVPQLVKLLKGSSQTKELRDWVSHTLIVTLKEMGTQQAEAAIRDYASKKVPKLLQVLTGDDVIRKNWISEYLEPLVPYSKDLLSRLMVLFETTEDFVMKKEIMRIVKRLGVHAKSATPTILSVLNNQGMQDERLWRQVNQLVRDMEILGPDHPDVSLKRFALLKILKQPELITRMQAIEALLAIGTPEAKKVAEQYRRRVFPHLKQVVTSQYKDAREQGVVFIVYLSQESKTAVDLLSSVLKDDYGAIRRKAVLGLKALGPHAAPAVPDLSGLWDDEYSMVRSLIPSTLKVIGTPEALQALQ